MVFEQINGALGCHFGGDSLTADISAGIVEPLDRGNSWRCLVTDLIDCLGHSHRITEKPAAFVGVDPRFPFDLSSAGSNACRQRCLPA